MQAQAAFLKGIKVRWLHVRSIGKLWWIVLAVVWGVFWSADQTIAKWGSPSLKLFWNTYTLHSPIDWKIGIIVLLVILALMLIEGSFRHHRETVIAHESFFAETLAAADKNLQSSLVEAEGKHRQALEAALSVVEQKHREELSAEQKKAEKHRDWAGDWKELAGNFREKRHQISANYSRTSAGEQWYLSGDNDAVRRMDSLRRHAGDLLLASPKVSQSIPAELVSYSAGDRWLFYLKATTRAYQMNGYGVERLATGERFNDLLGSIRDVGEVSANACMECASQEY